MVAAATLAERRERRGRGRKRKAKVELGTEDEARARVRATAAAAEEPQLGGKNERVAGCERCERFVSVLVFFLGIARVLFCLLSAQ
jgi:hypothetical protein